MILVNIGKDGALCEKDIISSEEKVPDINYDKFRLRIEGQVKSPYALTMKDLEKMTDKNEFVTLMRKSALHLTSADSSNHLSI